MHEAEACFRRALSASPLFVATHIHQAMLLADAGHLDEAAEHYGEALAIRPDVAALHNNLGGIRYEQGRYAEAVACCRQALALDSNCADAHLNLGLALIELGRVDAAIEHLGLALQGQPDNLPAWLGLSRALGRMGGHGAEAIACAERAIALDETHADAYIALGNLLVHPDQTERRLATYLQAQVLCPLTPLPGNPRAAAFSVVVLRTHGAGCTPVEYILGPAAYERHVYFVQPGAADHQDVLRRKADVLINTLTDADSAQAMLPLAVDLVERLHRPVVNHPRLIARTQRAELARRLAPIPQCHAPNTLRIGGAALLETLAHGLPDGFAWPVLLRVAGHHGGDEFERFDDLAGMVHFVSRQPDAAYYVIAYVDYQSADGYFRKYRWICVGGQLFAYHLAIHADWKVHHFRTDMARQPWMRQEEAAFLNMPGLVFNDARMSTLRAIASTVGLDYFGIDCALDRDGRIVVFEANATMLVHGESDPEFSYKKPHAERIKRAVDAMLCRLVGEHRSNA